MTIHAQAPAATATDHPASAPAITAQLLRRTFKGGIEAVRDIDLTVELLTSLSLRTIARYDR